MKYARRTAWTAVRDVHCPICSSSAKPRNQTHNLFASRQIRSASGLCAHLSGQMKGPILLL